MPTDEQVEAYLTHARRLISQHGWMVQGVMGDRPFAYTVGLTETGLPELAIVGLPHDMAADILNRAARNHLQQQIRPGDQVNVEYSIKFRAVEVSANFVLAGNFGVARNMYGPRLAVVQLLWPSKAGRWPDQPDWDLHPQAQEFPDRGYGFVRDFASTPPDDRRWFQCRYCGGLFVSLDALSDVKVSEERDACLNHERDCEQRPR